MHRNTIRSPKLIDISFSFINLVLLAAMAIICGIVDSILEKRFFPRGAPWLFDDNRSGDNTKINGLITAMFALITFVIFNLVFNEMLPN